MQVLVVVLRGLPLTLVITAGSFVIGAVAAVPLSLGLISPLTPLRLLCRLLVDLIRGVPVIVWLFVLKFGLTIGDFRFTPLQAAIVGLGVVSMAYLAEIYRGGIQGVAQGQHEAAAALGLGYWTTFGQVVAPQAVRSVSPSIATYFIGLLKNSSVASTIIVAEMVFRAQAFSRQNPTVEGVLPYLIAGLLYIALSLPVAAWSRGIDRRMRQVAI